MRHGEIMGIIHNEKLGSVLVQMPHEFRLAGAPWPFQRKSSSAQELVTQCLLIFSVFWSYHRENGASASPFLQVADARGFASTRIGHEQVPGTIVPGVIQLCLEPSSEGGLDEWVFSEGGMRHGYDSSHIVRTGKIRTGRSGSASGRAGGSEGLASFLASRVAKCSETMAG